MEVKILNIYNNEASPGSDLKGSHGEAFVITVSEKKILLDTGLNPEVLMHNMAGLEVEPDEIKKLFISHGHIDHTGGLIAFLESRTSSGPIPIVAHPDVREPKAIKGAGSLSPIGFPELSPALLETVEFQLSREPVEILPGLHSIGEIPLDERPEKPGLEPQAYHKINDQWEQDPILDDLSLALKTDQGLVIITGCCHAGLLNTCAKARRIFDDKIHAVIGGTHMMRYSDEEVEHVGDVLERDYATPQIYLNHCTGKKAVEQLRKRFGPDIVHDCFVGSELKYNC